MDLRSVMTALQQEDGLKNVMLEPAFDYGEGTGHQFSQAELIADVINIMRLDTRRMAEAHDVDLDVARMTPERAAEMLQGVAQGEDLGLIEAFDEVEDQRMRVLAAAESPGAVMEYQEAKQSVLHTVPDEAPLLVPDEVEEQVEDDQPDEEETDDED